MKAIKYLLANLLIVVVVYSNGAIISNYVLQKCGAPLKVPVPDECYETFLLFGVYSVADSWNHGVELYGITKASPATPQGEVVKLDLAEYFPYRRMDVQGRVQATRHLFRFGPAGRYETWKALAAKIRKRYNRLHPDTPLDKVVIVRISWPRREEGPELLKVNEQMSVLVAE